MRDPSGGVIPRSRILVKNLTTGFSRVVLANEEGAYGAAALLAGDYAVTAEAPGFAATTRHAKVETGTVTTVDFSLRLGPAGEVITVEAAFADVAHESHHVSGVVTRAQIENLPLNGRNFMELARLEPGVSVIPVSTAISNRQFDVSVFGAPGIRTVVTVDGGDIVNLIVGGGTGTNFSQEVVEEFQISTANFDLSTPTAAAGAVNIVTRSGGNQFHGSGYYSFRDHNLAAYPALARDPTNPEPFFARRQAGFHLGGPFRNDRLFFFTHIENHNQDGVVSIRPQSADLARFGVLAPSPVNSTLSGGRVDFLLRPGHTLIFRHSRDDNDAYGPPGSTELPSNWIQRTNHSTQNLLGLTSSLNPNLIGDLRFSYRFVRTREGPPSAAECPRPCLGLGMPPITIIGAGMSLGNATDQSGDQKAYDLVENLTWQKGNHRLQFGGQLTRRLGAGSAEFLEPALLLLYSPEIVRQFNADPRVPPPARVPLPAAFDSVDDILRLPLYSFVTGIGNPRLPTNYKFDENRKTNVWRFYAQDTWRVRPRLSVNYGMSWGYRAGPRNQDLPKPDYLAPLLGAGGLEPSRRDLNNFGPKAGFAWTLTEDNRTVVRGGAGIYYDIDLSIVPRARERAAIGPRGNGRFPLDGSLVPNPIPGIPGVPAGRPLSFTAGPSAFAGAHLLAILPTVRTGLQRLLGPPDNTDTSVRNIEVFKQGSYLFTRDHATAYSEHFSLGLQCQLMHDVLLEADFVLRQFIRGEMRNVDYNRWNSARGPVLPPCLPAEALDPKARCSTGPMQVITPSARSHDKGLLVRASKRYTRRTRFLASYALGSSVGWNYNSNKDDWFDSFGPTDTDRRHMLNVSGLVDLPAGFQVSFISTWSSRPPFNAIVSALDFNGDGTDDDVLPGARVNQFNRGLGSDDLVGLVNRFNQDRAGRQSPRGQPVPALALPAKFDLGDGLVSQDLRLSRIFRWGERYRLTAFGEVFNLFNVANLSGYGTNLREPAAFGQPFERVLQVFGSGGPRAFQFGGRFSF